MNLILLLTVMGAMLLQSVAKKQYNLKTNRRGAYLFNGVTTLSAAVFFFFTDADGFSCDMGILPFVLGFAVSYGSAVLFSFLAIGEGPLSLTSLLTSYSLIIPTFYGLIFLQEKASLFLILGLAFLLCSLFLVNKKTETGVKITGKWVLFAFLAFLGNGLCSTVQTAQQNRFDGRYKSEFMILALLILSAFFLTLSLFTERREGKECLKKGPHLMILNGLANALVNLFVMLLVSRGMPASIMFPVISGGGIILASLVSVFFYRETLSKTQTVGLALGTVSVILMNL